MDKCLGRRLSSLSAFILLGVMAVLAVVGIACSPQQVMELELNTGLNGMRAERGLAPLASDAALNAVARIRAEDMARNSYFSHQPPDGCDFRCLMNRHGVSPAWAGEIIAWNTAPARQSVAMSLDLWRNSPPHYGILTGCQFTRMGTGAAIAPDGRVYHVAVFEGASPGCQP